MAKNLNYTVALKYKKKITIPIVDLDFEGRLQVFGFIVSWIILGILIGIPLSFFFRFSVAILAGIIGSGFLMYTLKDIIFKVSDDSGIHQYRVYYHKAKRIGARNQIIINSKFQEKELPRYIEGVNYYYAKKQRVKHF